MATKHILILGGYGNTGLPIARLLLARADVTLTLAGRNLAKAQRAAENLDSTRVRAARVDAADPQSLRLALVGVDMVVVASGTAAYTAQVARAALDSGADYLDVLYAKKKMEALRAVEEEITRANRCFITDGGFHPGLPAAMVRYAATHVDQLITANVGSVIQINWRDLDLSPSTMQEFVEEFKDFSTLHLTDGKWQPAEMWGMTSQKRMDFGAPFGQQNGIPMFLEELRALPNQYPSLRETGFFVGGFNWFVDWFITPIIGLVLTLFPKVGVEPMSRILVWGLRTFSRPPYGTLLKLEATGIKNNETVAIEMLLSHKDGYELTAIPTVACLLQWLDGEGRKPGLWMQSHIVEPTRFFKDMEQLGVTMKKEILLRG